MINIQKATFSGLKRFAECVDTVMNADDISNRQRTSLIAYWAYRADEPGTPEALAEAIKRCQLTPEELQVGGSTIVEPVSGETVAFNNDPTAGSYD